MTTEKKLCANCGAEMTDEEIGWLCTECEEASKPSEEKGSH